MGNAVTNDTYTFTPQPHDIFNQENTEKNAKIQSATPIVLTQTKLRRLKGGIKK